MYRLASMRNCLLAESILIQGSSADGDAGNRSPPRRTELDLVTQIMDFRQVSCGGGVPAVLAAQLTGRAAGNCLRRRCTVVLVTQLTGSCGRQVRVETRHRPPSLSVVARRC